MRSYYVAENELTSLGQFQGFAMVAFSAGSFALSGALTGLVEWQVNDWSVGLLLMAVCLTITVFLYALGVLALKYRRDVIKRIKSESDATP